MADFDDIRPYNDDEVDQVLDRLLRDREFLDAIVRLKFGAKAMAFAALLRPLVKFAMRRVRAPIHSVADFQAAIEGHLVRVLDETTSSMSVSGLDKLDSKQSYLFICNHRDIAMDPALVNLALYRAGFGTLRIAIGDNLLTKPFASDLMRLNKSFIVNRSASKPREKLKAAKNLSAYIRHSVLEDGENVWIAQREGRAKDGLDRTNSAIISMLALSKDKKQSLSEFIAEARVVPVSISYEYDPCDADKARELYMKSEHGSYEKGEQEDVRSIARGITGYKGHVHVAFGDLLSGQFEDTDAVTAELDKQILNNYQLQPSNAIAYELLQSQPPAVAVGEAGQRFDQCAFEHEKKVFKGRLESVPVAQRDIFLQAYANPVRDRLGEA
ncbi:1-acyl-sn-glycerol-3-phosphate acyltransferase [Agaribacterium haliotis]|uniref:1-acyl-sn-glycerol-3-phosphate acyltransferase n=1 Tax=Agaribacterium haliotis TaxID=2013869 RepID=UPI000BB5424B|nr:1-acyl-sn-glycerol-3-phosphate acyltransferase [Agaribacterium haliotis]